jgi:DNA repair exonuclease SbcCD nuclease subunit
MKIAIVTDTHWGVRNDSAAFADYFKKFYDNVFFPYLEMNDVKTVFHLGDIVERRKYINFSTADRLEKDFVRPLSELGITTYYVVGNHDTYYKNTNEINAMTQLYGGREYSNMTIVSEPTEFSFDGCKIVLMPWMCPDNMERALTMVRDTSAQVLMGHLELAGFEMNKGAIIDHGMDSAVFDKFDLVCSGHYHHKSSRGNIHYLGCPYEITWSDYGDQKGFHVFDTETRELTFIPNRYTMFNKLHYDDSRSTLSELMETDFEQFRDTYVKVIVHTKTNPYWFDTFIDRLEKIDPLGIQVVEDNLYLNLEDDEQIVSEAEDTLTILKKFIDNVDLNVERKDVERFLTELYSEASSI